jgi:hypothetical protein
MESRLAGQVARVALIGESHEQILWPLLASKLRAAGHEIVYQVANPGWSEARFLKDGDLAARLSTARADVVIFGLGGNNRQSGATYTSTVKRLLAIASPARVVWIGVPVAVKAPFDRYHADTASEQAAILPGLGVTWIDSRPYTRSGHRADGVHFTSYRAWADGVGPAVVSAVAGSPPLASIRVPGPLTFFLGLTLAAVAIARWRASRVAEQT